jgi:hypothetical protein
MSDVSFFVVFLAAAVCCGRSADAAEAHHAREEHCHGGTNCADCRTGPPSRGSSKGVNLFWAQLDGSRTQLAVRTTSFPLGSQTRSAGLRPDPAKLSNAPGPWLKWNF